VTVPPSVVFASACANSVANGPRTMGFARFNRFVRPCPISRRGDCSRAYRCLEHVLDIKERLMPRSLIGILVAIILIIIIIILV